ncbi:MAG: sialidase family protein [Candidatus Baltobacteraceae bacterium]
MPTIEYLCGGTMKNHVTLLALTSIALAAALPAFAGNATMRRLSSDHFTNANSQHHTELEPDTFAYRSTEVAVFQEGRFYDGGSSDTGWATSSNGGRTWKRGVLPGITKIQDPANGKYDRVSDPSVAYDAKHGVWLIAGLPLVNQSSGPIGQVPVVNSSSDGIHWNNPVKVAPDNGDYMDKDWIVCDNGASSPHAGNCYLEWDDNYQGDLVMMSTSSDGGQTWSTPYTVNNAYGLGGQPLAQPNGNVVVPFSDGVSNVLAFSSTDGGRTWGNLVTVAAGNEHGVAGNMRTSLLPSAEVDAAGKVYVVWQDCSFRTNCAENDIVMSSSTDGRSWSPVARIPIDPTNSTVDHFIPGLAVNPRTSGSSAKLGLTYYYFPQANCSVANCALTVGYVSSHNGGATWSAPTQLSPAMNVQWLANTNQGYMVGDYMSNSFVGRGTHGAFAVAAANSGTTFFEAMFTSAAAQPALASSLEFSSRFDRRVRNAHSDHARRRYPPTAN